MKLPKRHRIATAATVAATAGAILLPATPASATYPGRNGLIAFSANAGSGAQIYTVRPDGRRLHPITALPGDDAVNPDWSPDGRAIAFELDAPDGVTIQLMNADGGDRRALMPAGGVYADPSFTPDGRRIVFERFIPETTDDAIWSMNVDGSHQHRIVGLPNGASDPNLSPDGTTLTFRSGDGSGTENGALFRSTLRGATPSQLTPFDFVSIKHDWSPGGRTVLYSDNADTGDPGISTNIATIRPDGTGIRHLTHYTGGAVNAFAGSYSPDGRWIVLRLEDHGDYALYKMRADGSRLTPIIDLGSLKPRLTDWGPQPDGPGDNAAARSPDDVHRSSL